MFRSKNQKNLWIILGILVLLMVGMGIIQAETLKIAKDLQAVVLGNPGEVMPQSPLPELMPDTLIVTDPFVVNPIRQMFPLLFK
ncbi:hypothetical protein KKD70_04830 [Patescibacteria group bacterium]|nr:hypothetical protein [Patescibacteria group bacterium]